MGIRSEEPVTIAARGNEIGSTAGKLTPDAQRLLTGPVLPTLLRLAAPTVALMLLQGLIAAGETAFVGWLGPSALAGVSLSFPFVILMSTLSAGAYGGGVSSGVAHALGAGKPDDAARLAGTALGIAAFLGAIYTLVMLAVGRALYTFLGASGAALQQAIQYSDILFLGAAPFWVYNGAASILRGGGNAIFPAMVGTLVGTCTLAISPLLIFGAGPLPGFGLAGAASAVIGYNVIMACVLLRTVWSQRCPARPSLRALVPRWQYAVEILHVSVPSAGSTLLTNLTLVVLTGLVAPFGEAAIAGYGAGGRLEYLLVPIVFGIGTALIPLVAASDGAGNQLRVRQFTRAGAALGAGVCGLAGAVVTLYPRAWMGIFTRDPHVTEVGSTYLIRVGPAYIFLGLGLALYFAAQGRRRTVQPLLASLTRLLVAGVGGWTAVRLFGRDSADVFTLMAASLAVYAAVMVVVMRRELGFGATGS